MFLIILFTSLGLGLGLGFVTRIKYIIISKKKYKLFYKNQILEGKQ